MREIEAAKPNLLLIAGIAAPAVALLLMLVEIGRIQRQVGQIGGFASLGFILAIGGAAMLAAHLSIRADSTPAPSVVTSPRDRPPR